VQNEKPVFVSCSLKEDSSVVNLNYLTGLLTSEMFWHPISLKTPLHNCFQCGATILETHYGKLIFHLDHSLIIPFSS